MKNSVLSVEPLGPPPWPTDDPFLFCVHHLDAYPKGTDEMGPAASLAGRRLGMDFDGIDGWRMYHGQRVPGFPQHPHRGFETVTVVRQGLVDHADSLGATARYGDGDAQWLTAGSGIVHAEMFPLLKTDADNPLELFQIWLNLPAKNKMCAPYFEMFWANDIPTLERDGAKVRIIAGSIENAQAPAPPPDSWASQEGADVAIWTITLDAGGSLKLPPAQAGSRRSLYLFEGSVSIDDAHVKANARIRLASDAAVTLQSKGGAELLLLQGTPIAEPVAQHGPFVMNTRAELQQAFIDYQRTQFGGWPWDHDAPVHPASEGRHAKRPDGKVERPRLNTYES